MDGWTSVGSRGIALIARSRLERAYSEKVRLCGINERKLDRKALRRSSVVHAKRDTTAFSGASPEENHNTSQLEVRSSRNVLNFMEESAREFDRALFGYDPEMWSIIQVKGEWYLDLQYTADTANQVEKGR